MLFCNKMKRVTILVIALWFALCESRSFKSKVNNFFDPDIFRNVSKLITSKGYPVEEHTVQTSDGFILSLQRIPHGRNGDSDGAKKKVVFLQHGLLSAATDWVINFPEQSLGFILADSGYDVWLGNTRGNTYSRKHIKYSPHQKQFWNFSFDEMGQFDIPAMVDYVLNATGEENLYYIGHSQGTTQTFALLSESPEYNKKIKLFVALAPVTSVGHMTSVIRYLAPFSNDVDLLLKLLGVNEFLPNNLFMKIVSEIVCETMEKFLCEDVMFVIFGADKAQLNTSRIGVYSAHTPAGTSVKSIIHYAQLVNSKLFAKFDYGDDNMDHYHQKTPPEYDVSRITTPVALLWSQNDMLGDPADVKILQGKLKSMVKSYDVPDPDFNHGDFVLAIDAHKLVYDEVLSLLTQY